MAKEYINCREFDVTFGTSDNPHVDHTSAKVSWGRDQQNVAVALVDFAKDPDGMEEQVKYLNLDRHGVNRLITVLRRARDAAFGADA